MMMLTKENKEKQKKKEKKGENLGEESTFLDDAANLSGSRECDFINLHVVCHCLRKISKRHRGGRRRKQIGGEGNEGKQGGEEIEYNKRSRGGTYCASSRSKTWDDIFIQSKLIFFLFFFSLLLSSLT